MSIEPAWRPKTASCGSRTSSSSAPGVASRNSSSASAAISGTPAANGSASSGSLTSKSVRGSPCSGQAGSLAIATSRTRASSASISSRRPLKRRADPENQLQRLAGLPGADESGEHAEHPALRATRHAAFGRRLGKEAAITRTARREHADLSVEAKDRAVDVGLVFETAGVVDEVTRAERIGRIDDDIVEADQFARVARVEARLDRVERR